MRTHDFMIYIGKQWNQWKALFSWGPESLWLMTEAMRLKDTYSWEKSFNNPRQCIKKQRHDFVSKSPYSQSLGLPVSHARLWELDHKEGWELKNWCFWTVGTLESPWDCKEIKPVHPKGDQSEYSLEGLCWSWSSNTVTTWREEPIHWKRRWCWDR